MEPDHLPQTHVSCAMIVKAGSGPRVLVRWLKVLNRMYQRAHALCRFGARLTRFMVSDARSAESTSR